MKQIKHPGLILIWLGLALLFPWLVMGALGPRLEHLWNWTVAHFPIIIQRWLQPGWMHSGLFAVLVLAGGLLLRTSWMRLNWGTSYLLTALAYGLVYKIASFLPDISTYPFSLSWSEASRYYNASLFFSKSLYGLHTPLSVLHPSRYLLQAIPFILPLSPLWLHRAWQVLLWLLTSGLTGWLVAHRAAGNQSLTIRLALAGGAILFLFQGPVYYHLLVMVIIVLWGFNRMHPWRTLTIVLLASLWAGISRVNWLPVPGLLAAAIYFLEVPFSSRISIRPEVESEQPKSLLQSYRQYLLHPVLWVLLGSVTAWASQQAYKSLSGNPVAYFGSSFSSDLLWYRLLPNPTYPLGILPSALLVSLPAMILMGMHLRSSWRNYHPLRLLGLGAILCVLFAGGVLVSVKIGGGSNLHNLDAFLVLLLMISNMTLFSFVMDTTSIQQEGISRVLNKQTNKFYPWLVGLAAVIPLLFTISSGGPWPQRDQAAARADLETLRRAAQQAVINGGEVLFINQRHLLTFSEIPNVPLMEDYELVFLMEMAMAGNQMYLNAFHTDLQNHRFDLIIAEPLNVQYQGSSHSFGEENDAWVAQVSEPMLCYYRSLATLETAGVVLYVPDTKACP